MSPKDETEIEMRYISEKPQTSWHPLTMAPPKFTTKSVDSVAADAAHAELAKFVGSRNPGVVDKKPDMALDFESYLKTPDLQKTNALVTDFLNVSGF